MSILISEAAEKIENQCSFVYQLHYERC